MFNFLRQNVSMRLTRTNLCILATILVVLDTDVSKHFKVTRTNLCI